jgi:CRP/FNR family transcriptional regulator
MKTCIHVHKLETILPLTFSCAICGMRQICMPPFAPPEMLEKLDEIISLRKRLKAGTVLYHSGSSFQAIYAVKTGFFKTEDVHEDGKGQVTGFYMMGETFGFDGIDTNRYRSTSTALEDSEVCVIPFGQIEGLTNEHLDLKHHFSKLMSREITHNHSVIMFLGSMTGEERVAAFILNLSQRYHAREFSRSDFTLRMKREEMGSYLGLKFETISRIFSKFQEEGLLEVHRKSIRILDMEALTQKVGHSPRHL